MKIINTPVKDEDIAALRAGDIVYFSGTLATGRDAVYRRAACGGIMPPFDLSGLVVFHAGPIVRKTPLPAGGCGYELVSVGPTSSIRMEEWAADFIEKTGVKIMIGKGGMGDKTAAACRASGVIHCVYPGGCAAMGAGQVEKITAVYWEELGMPEALWVMEARMFGPLIVSIDTLGTNIFTENAKLYASRKEACMKPIIENMEGGRKGKQRTCG